MLELTKMNQNDYQIFFEIGVRDYEEELIQSGIPEEKVKEIAIKTFNEALKDGLETKGHDLFNLTLDGKNVGFMWFEIKENNKGFINYLFIYEEYRKKGLGKLALQLLDEHAKGLGIIKISLHVFGYNKSAITLYEKMCYSPTNIIMVKEL